MKLSNNLLPDVVALPLVQGNAPALDPKQLGSMAQEAEHALLRQGDSENTLRSYRSALRYWAVWFALRYHQAIALPVAATAVVQFIVDHAQRRDAAGELVSELPPAIDQALVEHRCKAQLGPLSLNTVVHRVSVLSKAHQLQGAESPCAQPRVRELLAKTRRGYAKRGALPSKKPALTREPLEALLQTCDDSLAGLRDHALLLFAFSSGGRRRSEVTAATMENTCREGEFFIFTLATSKTNQAGTDLAENDKPIAGRAAHALTAWLAASKIKSGAIFRRVRRGGVVGEPLSPAAVRDIVKKRCGRAGLAAEFSAHSLRSGFVTEAGRRGVPLGETMAMTGHRTTASLVGYFRHGQGDSLAANLLDNKAPWEHPLAERLDHLPKVRPTLHEAAKQVRNRLRRFSARSIAEHALTVLQAMRKEPPMEELRSWPWITLLIVKLVLEDEATDLDLGLVCASEVFDRCRETLWNAQGGRDRKEASSGGVYLMMRSLLQERQSRSQVALRSRHQA